jgi:hypothetical protein
MINHLPLKQADVITMPATPVPRLLPKKPYILSKLKKGNAAPCQNILLAGKLARRI